MADIEVVLLGKNGAWKTFGSWGLVQYNRCSSG